MAVSREALPEPYKYRGGCAQPIIGVNAGSPMVVLEKGLKELRGFAAPWREQQCQLELPGTGPSTRIHVEGPMALAAYVAEDGLVEHQ